MTTMTPEQFLSGTDADGEELNLIELAVELERRVAVLEGLVAGVPLSEHIVGELVADAPDPAADELQSLTEAYADLDAKFNVLNALVEQIRGIVKPSTSKVSLAVKAAIEAWANPEIPETTSPAPDAAGCSEPPETAVPAAPVEASAGEVTQPAHDADVEEWYWYAVSLGHDAAVVENLNRSQIRTLLGIEQPASAS